MATEAVAQGWSSLPADLVNCMDLRAVCHCWRSATADPKTSHDDARFRPSRWLVPDEASQGDTRLFVHAATGRFLRDHHFVTSTTGGFIILAEREPPHAAPVLKPFTGTLTRFKAPITPSGEAFFTADVVGDLPTLVLASSNWTSFFLAHPDSHRFDAVESEMISDPITSSALLVLSCAAVELAPGEMLRVDRSPRKGVQAFRMDSEGRAMERVTNIGSYALFLSSCRCVSVRADSFPSINANCIYYAKEKSISDIYMYDLAHEEEERIAEPIMYSMYPESLIRLLLDYTVCPPFYQPGWGDCAQKTARIFPPISSFSKEKYEDMWLELQMEMEMEEVELEDGGCITP